MTEGVPVVMTWLGLIGFGEVGRVIFNGDNGKGILGKLKREGCDKTV